MPFPYLLYNLCFDLCSASELVYSNVSWRLFSGAVHSSGAEVDLGSELVEKLPKFVCGAAW